MRVGRNPLAELIAVLMLYREDIQFSDTVLVLAQTVHEYLFDAPVM